MEFKKDQESKIKERLKFLQYQTDWHQKQIIKHKKELDKLKVSIDLLLKQK